MSSHMSYISYPDFNGQAMTYHLSTVMPWSYTDRPANTVNGDQTSVNGDGKLKSDSSDLGESNAAGGDLPRMAMAADHASKAVSFPAVVHGQNGGFRWQGAKAFTIDGLRTWGKVRGKKCAFLNHVGTDPDSTHKRAKKSCEDLMNQSQHIQHVFHKYTTQDVVDNRLRVKFLIRTARYLALQGSAFRGHDESKSSDNRGNFLKLLEVLVEDNEIFANLISKAPRNAIYTSPKIQKEIFHIYSMKVRKTIREEIGDAKFCIIIDEACDKSKKEQMAIVLRFVDKDGIVRERFFGLVHVSETSVQTLKKEIYFVLYNHTLEIQNIRGQGYDGASNMRDEWNGLQALILKDCPYAYYIHCLAHLLQLTLVAVSQVVIPVHHVFTKLTSVLNIVGAFCKRNDELKHAKADEIAHMLALDERETSKGLNQIGTLQRASETQRGSHFKSVSSLINMFSETCDVLINIMEDRVTYASREDVDATYEVITSFEFVFVLHLMKNIMVIADLFSQALQCQSQDILNVMRLVSSTKVLLQKMRDEEWQNLLEKVISFCKARNIDIPYMNAQYIARQATTERSFLAMNIVNTRLCNKMDDDFLTDTLITYIERDIAKKSSMESVIDDFRDMKEHKVRF
ncbi:TTF-type domain-containing protein [Citrus sinensis]|nr:TTF-type domain-containing protein [Citrus sinensis]